MWSFQVSLFRDALRVPVAVSLSGGMSVAWLCHNVGWGQGFLSVTSVPVSGIVGFIIMLNLSSRACSIRCVVYV